MSCATNATSDFGPNRALVLGICALTIAGFVLRLCAARGDLWLDEIWSIQNLQHVQKFGEIFWGISDDNNHLLNSVWLWIVGPRAPPDIIRLEAIVLGTYTVPVAAKLCARSGAVAALAGAALVAFSDLFVHYGSEARGYAGLLLMIFVAAETLERFLENPDDHRSRLAFGVAVALGALFHLTMLIAAFTLIVATLGRIWRRGRSLRRVGLVAIDLSIPAVLGALPALAFLLAGILNTHRIELGEQVPFTFARLGRGLTTLFAAIFGLPYSLPLGVGFAIALVLTVSLFLAAERRILPLACLLLPPALASLLHLPNVHIARFHLVAALGFVLLFAEAMAKLSSLRQTHLMLAIGLLVAVGNGRNVAQLLILGRGDYEAIVARMESAGPATYGSNMPAEVGRTLRFYDRRFGGWLAPVSDWCGKPPDWFVLSDDRRSEAARRTFGPRDCAVSFMLDRVMRPAPLSGLRLALYRRGLSARQ